MKEPSLIVHWQNEEQVEIEWRRVSLSGIGKDEKFLENLIARHLDLLNLKNRRLGIQGPFKVFQQFEFHTPQGRSVIPDIVILAASGHVIVVEVKLSTNPELKDRRVIAQVIDYAASFSQLDESSLVDLFGSADIDADEWPQLIASLFPNDDSPDELANLLFNRIQQGELNLIIACDGIPLGLTELIAGVASQSALGFALDLVEVVPHASTSSDDLLFSSNTRLGTEIVARTAVTVMVEHGTPKPEVTIQTTAIEDIEDQIDKTKKSKARVWSATEVENAVNETGDATYKRLFDFAKQQSLNGQVVANSQTISPTFGFYVPILKKDGTQGQRMAFFCVLDWGNLGLYMKRIQRFALPEVYEKWKNGLRSVLGDQFNEEAKELIVSLPTITGSIDSFEQVMLELKHDMSAVQHKTDVVT